MYSTRTLRNKITACKYIHSTEMVLRSTYLQKQLQIVSDVADKSMLGKKEQGWMREQYQEMLDHEAEQQRRFRVEQDDRTFSQLTWYEKFAKVVTIPLGLYAVYLTWKMYGKYITDPRRTKMYWNPDKPEAKAIAGTIAGGSGGGGGGDVDKSSETIENADSSQLRHADQFQKASLELVQPV